MVHVPREISDGGISLNLGQSPPRWKRKKSAWAVWLQACAILLVFAILAGLGWWLLTQDSHSIAILPIADQEISPGDKLRMQIPIHLVGYQPEQVTYSLAGAPPDSKFDEKSGVFTWAPTRAHRPGTYQMVVKVVSSGSRPRSGQQSFRIRLRGQAATADGDTGPSFADMLKMRRDENPFEAQGETASQSKIDELVFAKLKQLKIEPANFCSDAVFLRRAYLDTIGTLPTAEEAKSFLEDENPKKRAALVDQLLQRPEFADYWAMKWSDLLRVKAEFPINLWPNAAQAYHRWLQASLRENTP
jgi:hypothetical protein